MIVRGDWEQGNSAYLEAALKWLRLRLLWQIQRDAPPPGPPADTEPKSASAGGGIFGRKKAASAKAPPLFQTGEVVSDELLAEAAADMTAAARVEPPPALLLLSQRFSLSRFEQQVLLLCTALEMDPRIASLCARVQDDPQKTYPTFALALAILDDPAWEALSPSRPLRYWRLIEIHQPGGQSLAASALRADEHIADYVKGLSHFDERLSSMVTPLEAAGSELPPSQQVIVDSVLSLLQHSLSMPERVPVIQLTGPHPVCKREVAAHVAAKLGLRLYLLGFDSLPTPAGEMETFARYWQRESQLLPIALYIGGLDSVHDAAANGHPASLVRFLSRARGLFLLDARDPWPELADSGSVFDVSTPTPAEQKAAWSAELGPAAGDSPDLLAGQFNLEQTLIQRIARAAVAAELGDGTGHDRRWDYCRQHTRPRLSALAQRLDPKARWADIVLPEEAQNLLQQITAQVRCRSRVYEDWGFRTRMNRGLGISALFAGESGTGKTMAAEVIANDLRLDLYRIDLSAVVSKYIGETEKNLRRMFDAAEDGGAILFFDEADALFGKRSEVKDSHDRYANIEINYLLQRMEAYRGLAILATNMKKSLDSAFMRRLRFVVNFPFPGVGERRRIWERVFPPETPKHGLDFERLARLNLTGGSIHNIALGAAFLASLRDPPVVTMPVVLEAARTEFHKLDKPISEAEFHWKERTKGSE